jgi:hypothetical protein
VTLAVATHAVHVLPKGDTPDRAALEEEVLTTIDTAVAGSLRRCHLALHADGRQRGYTADEWLPVSYTVADEALQDACETTDPRPIVRLSQEAAHWVAMAMDALDGDGPSVTGVALGRARPSLVVSVFADIGHAQTEI